MSRRIYTKIKGTGSYIPENIVENKDFLQHVFYDQKQQIISGEIQEVINKFKKITNIEERRYADDSMVTSDLAFIAAEQAIRSADIDRETIDGIIVAHNFGDVKKDNRQSDLVPSIASRVKYKLGINNPKTAAFDLIFGCPGWLQGVIQANYQIKAGYAKRIIVIGSEMLSRVSDPHDRDSMIYSDGAGATILEAVESDEPTGILSLAVRTDAINEAQLLGMKGSNSPHHAKHEIYLKMEGRKLYEYALNNVPSLVKECIDQAKLTLKDIHKVLIHQANEKMDEAILERLFKLYDEVNIPKHIMPMIINKLGNSSVATLPTLLDLILKNKMEDHKITTGDTVVFASVGAGMNINAITYKF
jgi:3-oxoacyl-[acyl-carrier-protein] synthase-3